LQDQDQNRDRDQDRIISAYLTQKPTRHTNLEQPKIARVCPRIAHNLVCHCLCDPATFTTTTVWREPVHQCFAFVASVNSANC